MNDSEEEIENKKKCTSQLMAYYLQINVNRKQTIVCSDDFIKKTKKRNKKTQQFL